VSPDGRADYARGILLALAGVILVSFEALILRLVTADIWTVIWWRGVLVFLTVSLAMVLLRRAALRLSLPTFSTVIAILSFTGAVFCFVGAVNLTTTANTLVIASVAPALAAFFSWFFLGERVSRATWFAAGALFVGLTIVFSGSLSGGKIVGDIFALAYAIWLANYFVALRSSPGDSLFPIVAGGGLLSALLAAPMASPLSVTPSDLALMVGLGVLLLPVSIVLLAFGTRYVPAPDVVMIMMLEAVLGPLWVWLILSEIPSHYTVAGGGVILITIVAHAQAELSVQRPVPAA